MQEQTITNITENLNFDCKSSPLSWPSVSLCMIVRNEEANLTTCLESIGDFATEIIVVDTGSTDRTVEIARSFGAHVKHFPWIDDFAAARNESIREARGDWIFWLDADDQLSPDNLNRLKNAVNSGQADAYRCRMISPLQNGPNPAINAVYYTLLFRNVTGIQFEGPIHETVTDSLTRQGMTIANTSITITHSGYTGDRGLLEHKAQRNVRILRQCVAKEPDNLKWRYHLGVSLYQLQDFIGAIEQFETLIHHPALQTNDSSHLYKAYILLASAYTTLPNPTCTEAILFKARQLFPKRRHAWITSGMFYLNQDRPKQAITMLEHARTLPSEIEFEGEAWAEGVLEKYLGLAYQAVGMRAWQTGNYIDATLAFQNTLKLKLPPPQDEIYKMLALCLQKLGQSDEALLCWQLARQAEHTVVAVQ